ncbi:MAG: hypothetical protein ABI592_05675 [Acidobacteriota bacterium]
MSLIDEALKRAREQAREAAPAAETATRRGGADPWAYAPLPLRRTRGKTLAVAAGIVLAVAGGAGAFFALRGRRPSPAVSRAPAAAGPAVRPPVSAPPSALSSAAGPAAAVPSARVEPSARIEPRVSGAGPTLRAGGAAADRSAARAPVPVSAAVAPKASPAAATVRLPPPRLADGRTYAGELTAPNGARVELGGIVYSEASPVALLNGRVLPVGGVVEGLTIAGIEENRVTMRGESMTVYLTLK